MLVEMEGKLSSASLPRALIGDYFVNQDMRTAMPPIMIYD